MRRVLGSFFCAILLLFSCACAGQKSGRLEENFTLPLEFNADFETSALSGRAHFVITGDELNFGVTSGTLQGLVAHVTESGTQFLYGGMDLSFSPEATQALQKLHRAFLYLAQARFSKKDAMRDETALSYRFSTDSGALTVFFTPDHLDFSKLIAETGAGRLTLCVV